MLVKFKVSDKQLKIVRQVKSIDYENSEIIFYSDNNAENKDGHYLDIVRDFDDVIFLMSTGLMDKDGVEIYEGDICYWEENGLRGIFTVGYSDESMNWIVDANFRCSNLSNYKDYYLKIIGNTYEGSKLYQEQQGEIMDFFKDNEDIKKSKRSFAARKALGYGKNFESFISAACYYYRDNGIADISKVDEPFTVLKLYGKGQFKGQFTKKANPDFEGTLKGGQSICFEAKYTSQKRMAKSVISDKQEEVLSYKSVLGAVVGVCVGIVDRYFFVPWEVWANMEEIYGKKSVNADDLARYEVKFRRGVMFLDRAER